MDQKTKVLSIIWLVIEAVFLALVLYLFGDMLIAIPRITMLSYTFYVAALALLIPGAVLAKSYLDYSQGKPDAKRRMLICAAISAVVFGLSLVPGVKTFLFGLHEIPALQRLQLRILNLRYGPGGASRIFVLDLVVQAVLPLALLALCEGRELFRGTNADSGTPVANVGQALLRIIGTVAAVGIAFAITVALIRSGTFDHSWLIIGFVPIPGQVMLAIPAMFAFAIIVVLWSKPWKS